MATEIGSTGLITADTPAELLAEIERRERSIQVLTARIRLLEGENAALAEDLRRHGVEARASSEIALELPPPLERPLAADAPALAMLDDQEAGLLLELCGGEQAYMLLRSNTRVDTGGWLAGRLLWVCATRAELVVFAAGKRPHAEKLPFASLQRSIYNHVTGEVVLAPASNAGVTRIKLAPGDAYQLLAQIYQKPAGE